jgi:hypothetical protein
VLSRMIRMPATVAHPGHDLTASRHSFRRAPYLMPTVSNFTAATKCLRETNRRVEPKADTKLTATFRSTRAHECRCRAGAWQNRHVWAFRLKGSVASTWDTRDSRGLSPNVVQPFQPLGDDVTKTL